MSKKQKPPETATILIRLNGDETTATLIRDEFPTQTIRRTCARRNPADTYNAYEGARIALARLYGKEPFPKPESLPSLTEKVRVPIGGKMATVETVFLKPSEKKEPEQKPDEKVRFKVGDKAVVGKHTISPNGLYATGDRVAVTEVRPTGYYVKALNDPRERFYRTGFTTFVRECELKQEKPAKAEPVKEEKPAKEGLVKEEPKTPFTPSFQVGDIVRTEDKTPFSEGCRNCVAVVRAVKADTLLPDILAQYELDVVRADGQLRSQCCHEDLNAPAPLKLMWRGGECHG